MEHMRAQMDVYDKEKLPEKDKEIKSLKNQIECVINKRKKIKKKQFK